MREAKIEKGVNRIVRDWGIIYLKNRPIEAGYTDRSYVLPNGLIVWIEYKRPGEKPDRLQIYRMERLWENHCIVGWTDELPVAVRVLKALLDAERLSEKGYPPFTRTILGGLVPRPRSGENFRLSSYLQDLKDAGFSIEDAYYRTPAPDVQGVAGRDREME